MYIEKFDIQIFLLISSLSVVVLVAFAIILVLAYSKNLRQRQKNAFKQVLNAVENERKKIGQNLHDDVGPYLASTSMQLNAIARNLDETSQLKSSITTQVQHLKHLVKRVRETSHELSPKHLLQEGLIAAVEERCQEISALENWQATAEAESFPEQISSDNQLNIFRILNELFHNSLKHSGGNKIHVKFTEKQEILEIIYSDNGTGLSKENPATEGIGLSGIKTRTELMRGNINFATPPGFKAILTFKIAHLHE